MENVVGACNWGKKYREEVYTLFRIITGFLFLYHGYLKIGMGQDAVTGFFTKVNIPMPEVMALLVTYGEIIAGIALIIGIYTHWAAKLAAVIILGAIYFVHLQNGYDGSKGGYEYQLLILGACLLIATTGAGKYSLDAKRAARTVASTV